MSTSTKVPRPKKKRENKGEPTHRTKDKHQIEKIPNVLSVKDLEKIRQTYDIPTRVGLMPVPPHLCDADDPPLGWWVIH